MMGGREAAEDIKRRDSVYIYAAASEATQGAKEDSEDKRKTHKGEEGVKEEDREGKKEEEGGKEDSEDKRKT